MKLCVFLHNTGAHPGGWRMPESAAGRLHDIATYRAIAETAEKAKFHVLFTGDAQGYLQIPGRVAFASSDNAGRLEPLTLLSALAMTTRQIGLIGTASTTYNEPYALARRFASLDHISAGRAGWNVVTSTTENEARNFGRESHMGHDLRYERAEEFVDVVKALWDSWEDDAVLADRANGRYIDPAKVHALEHAGKHFRVAGPLNVGRPPQGHPVIVQAGSSEPGRQLAARTADLVFTAQPSLASAKAFYGDIKARAAAFGRDPAQVLVIPSVQLLVRSTEAEARTALEELTDLIPSQFALSTLQMLLGNVDLSGYPADGPLPEIALTDGGQGQWVQAKIIEMAKRDRLSIAALARRVSVSRASWSMAGTPEQVADMLTQWFREKAADGFSLAPNYLPGGLSEFTESVVPILQARGLFHTDYRGGTLRENLGLPRPPNTFVENPARGAEPRIWAAAGASPPAA